MATPAWLAGKPLYEWFEIPSTSATAVYNIAPSVDPASCIDAWSGFAFREDTNEIFFLAAGGHNDSSDNRVVSIDLRDDAPTWVLRNAPTPVVDRVAGTGYYNDGKPASCHIRYAAHWIPERNRVMRIGASASYINGEAIEKVDGFNPDTNTWDAAGTWIDTNNGLGFARFGDGVSLGTNDVLLDVDGRWTEATNTITTHSWSQYLKAPGVYDSTRNNVFCLQFGDNTGSSLFLGMIACTISSAGAQTIITFNDSAAKTAFIADAPCYSALAYDPIHDEFWFYPGARHNGSAVVFYPDPDVVYIITPNETTVWDISIFSSYGAGSVTPVSTPSGGAGINARFSYVPEYRGFVMMPQGRENLWFIRTSYGLPTFDLVSPYNNANAPFSLGQCFAQGDVPSGSQLIADISDFQYTAKSTWPDGSLRFAILAGRAPLSATVTYTVALSIGTPTTLSSLTATNLRSTSVVAAMSCSFGTVTWSGADWESPFLTWVSGPKMSSFIYRKAVGADTHLVCWLEVRMWSGFEIEILPWVENGYVRVTAPTNHSATFAFAISGVQLESVTFNLHHHKRTPIIDGTQVSYWRGTDPEIDVMHDTAYLQSTEMVPTYSAAQSISAAEVVALVTSYTPLQAGNIIYDGDSMLSTGYQEPIGLLPLYDMLYLVARNPRIYRSILRNGYSSGRWSIHYRDETTNRPILFSDYPNLAIRSSQGFNASGGSTTGDLTPVATGSHGGSWDTAHSPAVYYMPYILSGQFYFMEGVQFAATCNYLGIGDNSVLRVGVQGLMRPCPGAWQTRACAWGLRALSHALVVTPDDDTSLRTSFLTSVHYNIAHFHATYIAQANNPFGWVEPGEWYGTANIGAPWQQDFITGALGYMKCLDLPLSATAATNFAAFFEWKAKSTVMRLGKSHNWWYINGNMYNQKTSPSTPVDYDTGTGPWYPDYQTAYSASCLLAANSPYLVSAEGTLGGEFDSSLWGKTNWGVMQPAISYACRHGVSGAVSAYERLTGATNYPAISASFTTYPLWSVIPASMTTTAENDEPGGGSSSSTNVTRLSFLLRRFL